MVVTTKNYRLERPIGEGLTSSVYLATEELSERQVALKVIELNKSMRK